MPAYTITEVACDLVGKGTRWRLSWVVDGVRWQADIDEYQKVVDAVGRESRLEKVTLDRLGGKPVGMAFKTGDKSGRTMTLDQVAETLYSLRWQNPWVMADLDTVNKPAYERRGRLHAIMEG